MANAAAPEPKENMGVPAPRYDARLKVTGEARYPSDMPVANPAYAVLVTSAIAKGRIKSLWWQPPPALDPFLPIGIRFDQTGIDRKGFAAN